MMSSFLPARERSMRIVSALMLALAVVALLGLLGAFSQQAVRAEGDTFTVPLCLQVAYQGHGPSGTSRWMLPVNTLVYEASTSHLLAAWTQTTDGSGGYCSEIAVTASPILVDIQVKHNHTLSNKKLNISLPGPGAYIDMGTLLEGDADGNDQVSITDFSLLRTTYGLACPACDRRADFNEDGVISILDFSLLRTNYARGGPITLAASLSAEERTSVAPDAGGVILRLTPGSFMMPPGKTTAAVDVVMGAGNQRVDGVDLYLDFDPRYVSITDAQGVLTDTISAGETLPVVLQNSVDNPGGRINFSAGILSGEPVSGTVNVARFYVTPLRQSYFGSTAIAFSLQAPRRTDVAYAGDSVLMDAIGSQISIPRAMIWSSVIVSGYPAPALVPHR